MAAIDYSVHAVNPAAQATSPAATTAAASDSGFSFGKLLGDLLDVVNPLQHLPVISTLYRHLTGDKIDTPEKLAGDLLYGGPIGFACSLGDTLFQKLTGKDVGDTVYAMVIGNDTPQTAVASAQKPVDVRPATSLPLQLSLPDMSFFKSSDTQTAQADMMLRAAKAYQTSQSLLPIY